MEEKNIISKNFIKFDRKMSFLEISGDALPIGKLRLGFRSYDKAKEKGSRITQTVDIYMDIDEAMYLAQEITSGKLSCVIKKNMEEAKTTNTYQKAAYNLLGGNNNNGKCMSRQLVIEGATNVLFKAMSGPGETIGNGLIKPKYTSQTAEQAITISMPEKDLKKFALVARSVCDAYYQKKMEEIMSFNV